ncbi:ABC transporter ATP-binding protein [Microvirga lotononidis]|uniref:ABC-type branched-chain amino acid transport system, ATPase component n=1 Tax=Microvirga lotononidis TaxID=864069 RepID=I4YLM5_9HYPH|nr:ABC transporter ATP-binding protein [Microvirga lotononidis]EIM24867.1 ABC-type branched-chain amino acid transport system, ATPase component [Microvirga lotononidis]WQO29631.1 ABC transporter ATP-binding protein [Microvirga lotononidis]
MLEVRNLRSAYGRIEVLKGIDLDVQTGEIVALVGSNGAGKTTLLRALSGVQPITGGEIRFNGQRIDRLPPHKRVEMGMTQSPEGRQVFGSLTVEDNLQLGAYRRRDKGIDQDRDRIFSMFPVLAEKRHLLAGGLSGGQQQMLAIGRALMGRPKLLLLDEPSLGLSPLLVDQILDAIVSLKKDGITVLLVEQNASAALAIADRGYVLETGKVAHSGSGSVLLADPQIKAAYLGIA